MADAPATAAHGLERRRRSRAAPSHALGPLTSVAPTPRQSAEQTPAPASRAMRRRAQRGFATRSEGGAGVRERQRAVPPNTKNAPAGDSAGASGPLVDWSGLSPRGAAQFVNPGASHAGIRVCVRKGSGRVRASVGARDELVRPRRGGATSGRSPLFRHGEDGVETAYRSGGCVYSCVLLLLLGPVSRGPFHDASVAARVSPLPWRRGDMKMGHVGRQTERGSRRALRRARWTRRPPR